MSEDLSTETATPDSAPEPEPVTPPETGADASEAEPVAAEPEPTPDPAEQRRAHVLNAVARKEARIQKERAAVAAERSEAQRIMSEARALREETERRAKAVSSVFDGSDDPIEALIALGIDPEKAIYGLNEKILSRGTPEAKQTAQEREIAELKAWRAQKERKEAEELAEQGKAHARRAAEDQFSNLVTISKDKYPGVAQLDPGERAERMWMLANAYVAKTNQAPTYEMVADAIEYSLRSEYDKLHASYSNGASESVRAGDGLQESKPKAPKLSSVLATQHATPPPKRELTEDEWRENFVRDWEKARANAQR